MAATDAATVATTIRATSAEAASAWFERMPPARRIELDRLAGEAATRIAELEHPAETALRASLRSDLTFEEHEQFVARCLDRFPEYR